MLVSLAPLTPSVVRNNKLKTNGVNTIVSQNSELYNARQIMRRDE